MATPTPLPESSPLAALSLERFGGPTFPRITTVSVGTTPTRLYTNNPNRVAVLVMNRAANNVAIGFDGEVTTTTGFLIAPNGGFLELTAEVDGEVVGYELYGISGVAAQAMTILEVVRL